jgi:AcrR family transcriptional regulator
MTIATRPKTKRRTPLTRERVLQAAIALADRDGLEALSMRRLGQELGVEAMALYRHVRDKDDLLDSLVEAIVGEILTHQPAPRAKWKASLRSQILEARAVMLRHPWARRVLEDRGVGGPATLAYIETVLATLRAGGFSVDLAHHALHVLGSRILGFNQDLFEDSTPDPATAPTPEDDPIRSGRMAAAFPRITELATSVSHDGVLGACDDDVEFAFGLDLVLDGLDRRANEKQRAPRHRRPG